MAGLWKTAAASLAPGGGEVVVGVVGSGKNAAPVLPGLGVPILLGVELIDPTSFSSKLSTERNRLNLPAVCFTSDEAFRT